MTLTRRGVIEYLGDAAGLRGREEWTMTHGRDGERTLTAHCRMYDTRLDRNVVHTVAADFTPLRSFVSQRRDGEFLGEGWFTMTAREVTGHLMLSGLGAVRQVVPLAGPMPYFVPHAVSGDSWIVPAYDRVKGGRQRLPGGFASSLLPDGSTGPRAEELGELTVRLVGGESVDVAAGAFDTWHFVVSANPGVEEHIWTTRDGHWTLVRLRSDRLATTYELVELTEETG